MSVETSVDNASTKALTVRFPADFVWGVATSSYQIEGGVDADGRSESIWDVFCRKPGAIADGSNGAVACDHYHRWADDVAMMKRLGVGAYRFSIAWPRVIPGGTGAVNEAGLDFYERLVDKLLANDIVPTPTLYHWDLPQVLEDRGGWLTRETAEAFADYTEAVLARLGDRVPTWMTLNEPYVSAHIGYAHGRHAPGHTDLASALTASHHLLLAHGLALERIRALAPGAEAGVVVNFTPLEPDTTDQADIDATRRENDIENRWYSDPIGGMGYPAETAESLGWDQAEVLDGDLERIAAPIDVFGVNFYTRRFISATGREPAPRGPVTDMGWEIHPPALGRLLRDLHARHGFPKYLITENGCAMPDATRDADGRVVDTDRVAYLASHLHEVHGAIEDGVPVAGYFAWSLMDNFEWGYGYEKRFGLVEVDYSTLERRPKHSALWYSEVMATGLVSTQEP